jgi:hypothetical protein
VEKEDFQGSYGSFYICRGRFPCFLKCCNLSLFLKPKDFGFYKNLIFWEIGKVMPDFAKKGDFILYYGRFRLSLLTFKINYNKQALILI